MSCWLLLLKQRPRFVHKLCLSRRPLLSVWHQVWQTVPLSGRNQLFSYQPDNYRSMQTLSGNYVLSWRLRGRNDLPCRVLLSGGNRGAATIRMSHRNIQLQFGSEERQPVHRLPSWSLLSGWIAEPTYSGTCTVPAWNLQSQDQSWVPFKLRTLSVRLRVSTCWSTYVQRHLSRRLLLSQWNSLSVSVRLPARFLHQPHWSNQSRRMHSLSTCKVVRVGDRCEVQSMASLSARTLLSFRLVYFHAKYFNLV